MSKTEPKIVLEHMTPGDLTPYELNVKKHDKAQVTKIARSIQSFGFDQPIVVDRNGVIIKGHGRCLAALELGLKTVPVWVRKDLNPEEVRAARLADNRVAQGDIDTEMLRVEMAGLDYSLEGIFDDKELIFATEDLGAMNEGVFMSDMDEVLEEQKRDMGERSEDAIGEGSRVPLAKAFGFKDVGAEGKLKITQFMARAEALTGLKNDEALIAYIGDDV